MRLVQWNIQQGKRWDRLVSAMAGDPQLREADLWTLAEVDCGTVRAGNRDVAAELASVLGMHWVFVATYLEFTKALGEDALLPGENEIGLHGIALFSRWPLANPGSAPLPTIFDYYDLPEEKRYGTRRVLWATVRHPRGDFLVATAHLEVRNTPAARARQMEAALRALPSGPCLFAGDWNTHTFRRGSFLRSASEFLRIQTTSPERMRRDLLRPGDREPLLRAVERSGFDLASWNDETPTALQVLSGVEELAALPEPLRAWLARRFRLHGRTLKMRLDWIAARGGWTPAFGQPPAAWTRADLGPEGLEASDHAPIGIDAGLGGAHL